MTIAERLRDLLQTFIDGDASRGMNDIQVLATEAEGKVLVKATVNELNSGCQAYVDESDICEVGDGETPAEALADLQRQLDEEAT